MIFMDARGPTDASGAVFLLSFHLFPFVSLIYVALNAHTTCCCLLPAIWVHLSDVFFLSSIRLQSSSI